MWLDPINQERRKVKERDEDREEMGHEYIIHGALLEFQISPKEERRTFKGFGY